MIQALVKILGSVILVLEQWKGKKTFKEVQHARNAMGHLVGYSISGFQIEIHCQRRHYRSDYDKWFVPNKNHIAFHVYAIVSRDAPEVLRNACQLTADIPALLPSALSDNDQREAAVQAYLDLLIARIGPNCAIDPKSVIVSYT